MNSELTIAERAFRDGIILDLRGDLTKQSEAALLHWRDWAAGLDGKAALALNLTEVERINSAGIALLIRLCQQGLKAGFAIYAYGVRAHYQKMFRLIGLTEFMTIYPDEYSLMLSFEP